MGGIRLTMMAISTLVLISGATIPPALAQGALDGHGYGVQATRGDTTYPDHLIFENGTFESSAGRGPGFAPAAYVATLEGDATVFRAVTTSPTEGSIAWEGRVVGETVTGTGTWTRDGEEPASIAFSGRITAGPLDGRQYTILLTEAGAVHPNVLTFAVGSFESAICRTYFGYYAQTYAYEVGEAGDIRFSLRAWSPNEGTVVWQGRVVGDDIEGTALWEKEGMESVPYTFVGYRFRSRYL